MFYFDKNSPHVAYCDKRQEAHVLCDERIFTIYPDAVTDVCTLPFQSKNFSLVVFDPPHLIRAGKKSWLRKKYGVLSDDWRCFLQSGFEECWRVLKIGGTLIFKWNEDQISKKEVLALFSEKPLFGHTGHNSLTHWYVFFKTPKISV